MKAKELAKLLLENPDFEAENDPKREKEGI